MGSNDRLILFWDDELIINVCGKPSLSYKVARLILNVPLIGYWVGKARHIFKICIVLSIYGWGRWLGLFDFPEQ